MTEVVPKDIKIDSSIAKKAIQEAFDIKIRKIDLIGEGWDNLVFLINEDLIFRFPRREVAIQLVEREKWVLKLIAQDVSLKIPYPKYSSNGTSSYPHPFYGHKEIKGRTGCSVSLSLNEYKEAASQLAFFLKTLHTITIENLKRGTASLKPVFDRMDARLMFRIFEERFKSIECLYDLSSYKSKIEKILENSSSYKKSSEQLSFVHGDLYSRHLIFNKENKLSGVIDWGDCCLSDHVVDLAVLFQYFPQEVHEDFFQIYGGISQVAYDYARFLGLFYGTTLLWYAHDRKDLNLIKSCLETFENL